MTAEAISEPTAPVKTPITGEDLFEMGDIGWVELVKGELKHMSPPGYEHGLIENNFGGILRAFVRQHKLGYVMTGEVGLYTRRNPDTVRGMDVAFISHERMAQVKSGSYLDLAPELIIEVLSPNDLWSEVNDKLNEYFAIGVKLVWIANPKKQEVHVYRSLTDLEILTAQDTLSGGEVLPGFKVVVGELFETA